MLHSFARKRPHSLLIGWAQATARQMAAYERLHRELGLVPASFLPAMTRDTFMARTEPVERLRLAHQLIQNAHPHQKLFVHAFSDNGFMNWAALCELLRKLPGGADVIERVACVLLDSAPGMLDQEDDEALVHRILFALNPVITKRLGGAGQQMTSFAAAGLRPVLLGYLNVFPSIGRFIRQATQKLLRFGPRCPYSFWYGGRDELVQSDKIARFYDALRAEGIPIEVECFEEAGHVALLVTDPARYKQGLRRVAEANGVIRGGAHAYPHQN